MSTSLLLVLSMERFCGFRLMFIFSFCTAGIYTSFDRTTVYTRRKHIRLLSNHCCCGSRNICRFTLTLVRKIVVNSVRIFAITSSSFILNTRTYKARIKLSISYHIIFFLHCFEFSPWSKTFTCNSACQRRCIH